MTIPPPVSLTIVTKRPALGAWTTPRAQVNGYPVALAWGANPLALEPGVHQVSIHMPWLWQFGKAEITVDNRVGPATVYYAAPWLTFLGGSIGHAPVKGKGLGLFVAVLIVPLALIFLCGILATIFDK